MRLSSWLLILFGSLLVFTGLATSTLARHQALVNLTGRVKAQLQRGARATYEPELLSSLRLLGYRIIDSPTLHEYRALFVTLNGPYQMLQKKVATDELLRQLGTAVPEDGKSWTASDFNPEKGGSEADYFACWQAMQGLLRDIGVTLFAESDDSLQLLILTDKQGAPFLEMRTGADGKKPEAETPWSAPQVTPELLALLKNSGEEAVEGYLRHGDGLLYLVRIQPFTSGGHMVLGHRLDANFETSLQRHIPGAEFRLGDKDPLSSPGSGLSDVPYLEHAEALPQVGDARKSVSTLWELRSLNGVESYLRSVTQGIAGLGLGAMAFGLLGILLATRSVTRQIQLLSGRMHAVGQGELGEDLPPAGPLEVRAATESFNQMVHQLRHKEMLAKMVPKQAREAIEQDQTRGGRVLARRIRTTVLFSDIRGFTMLSERLPAPEVMKLLDIYLARMTEVVESHGGDVNEYIGDAILADFEDRPDTPGAQRAVRACWQMRQTLEDLRGQNLHPEFATLHQGLGLHTGELVKGEVGAEHRSKFALIGDTVNLAARIQDRSRDGKHTGILLSAEARKDVSDFVLEVFGDESFKGKSGLIRVYEVVRPYDGPEASDAKPADETDPIVQH
ncbi:MAG: HAMP domain-containing protein [Candidatus Eremiobacteraeota bacterium]|mgnify:CR=1 FL=1|nr:HAMP domain-containing protein [Candidatus Eremiobacteraeota bacterium]